MDECGDLGGAQRCCAGDWVSLVSRRVVAGVGAEGGRLIVVDEPRATAGPRPRTAVYARVSSADQRADLDRQVARVTAWATAERIPVDKVVVEVGCALNGRSRKFLALLRDPWVHRIVVEHRDRLCRFGSE